MQYNPKCNIIFDKFLKAPRAWTNGMEVVGLLANYQALKSPPTKERHECINEQKDVIDDTLEDEEVEMGGTMTLNQNELHDLIWDEREDSDNEQVQKTRYLPSLWFNMLKNEMWTFL